MPAFTLNDLRQIMRRSVGVDEAVELDGDIDGTPFDDLGYDSLAVLEIQAQIQHAVGVKLPDDALEHMPTPGDTVRYVNAQLVEAAR